MLLAIVSAVLAAQTATVTAILDKGKGQVTLIGDQPGLERDDTFHLPKGGVVIFKMLAPTGPLQGVARIVFKEHPDQATGHQPLLLRDDNTASDILEAKNGVIRAKVREEAPVGQYRYDVELDGIRLKCLWAPDSATTPVPSKGDMGGAKRDPPP